MSQVVCEALVGIEYPAAKVTAKVPELVIGEPAILKPVGTVIATLVTVPVFASVSFIQKVPLYFNTWPELGLVIVTSPNKVKV